MTSQYDIIYVTIYQHSKFKLVTAIEISYPYSKHGRTLTNMAQVVKTELLWMDKRILYDSQCSVNGKYGKEHCNGVITKI